MFLSMDCDRIPFPNVNFVNVSKIWFINHYFSSKAIHLVTTDQLSYEIFGLHSHIVFLHNCD